MKAQCEGYTAEWVAYTRHLKSAAESSATFGTLYLKFDTGVERKYDGVLRPTGDNALLHRAEFYVKQFYNHEEVDYGNGKRGD